MPSTEDDSHFDLVLVFPLRKDGKKTTDPKKHCMEAYVQQMLGLKSFEQEVEDEQGNKTKQTTEFMEESQKNLRTDRCFLDDNGHSMLDTHTSRNHSSAGRKMSSTGSSLVAQTEEQKGAEIKERKRLLEDEYKTFVGDDQPTTVDKFDEMIAKSIAKRLQLACGLATRLNYSYDKDEIILLVQADIQDLMTEADRTDYMMQIDNTPFDDVDPVTKGYKEVFQKKARQVRVKGTPHDGCIGYITDGSLDEFGCWVGKSTVSSKPDFTLDGAQKYNVELESGEKVTLSGSNLINDPSTPTTEDWNKAMKKVREATAIEPDDPDVVPDPKLWGKRGAKGKTHQPQVFDIMSNRGHCENADPMEGLPYLAPYTSYKCGWEYMPLYRHYDSNNKRETYESGSSTFRSVDRIRLVNQIIDRHLNLPSLVNQKLLQDFFALHDQAELKTLQNEWALNWTMVSQPLGQIRNYFGEKIALYFAWLEFYTYALVFPAVYGLIMFTLTYISGNVGYAMVIFGGLVSVWSTLFCEMWKRKNQFYNTWWGMTTFKQQELARPEFTGVVRTSPLNDEKESYHSNLSRLYTKMVSSFLVVGMMILIVIGAVGGIFYYKALVTDPNGNMYDKNGALYAGVMNAVQIQVLNIVYKKVAETLNDWENHRTDTEYENQLIFKTFTFQFVNSYVSFFFIAFFKQYFGTGCLGSCVLNQKYVDCVVAGGNSTHCTEAFNPEWNFEGCASPDYKGHLKGRACMGELQTQLATIFLTRLIIGNLQEILIPLVKVRVKTFLEARAAAKAAASGGRVVIEYHQAEEEAKLNQYEEKEAFEDYGEMVVQFGFVTLFVVAFPLTPLLAFINNVAEVHVDAVKMVFGCRRPTPRGAENIGMWENFISLMSTISVITNTAIVVFVAQLDGMPTDLFKQFIVFIIAEHALLFFKSVLADWVPDMPEDCAILNERFDYIQSRVFEGVVIDDDDDLEEQAEENVDYQTIHDSPAQARDMKSLITQTADMAEGIGQTGMELTKTARKSVVSAL
jgi:hypothetical protein